MISVAMATYNGAKYLIEQLESIRNQTYKVDEIIVVDDCSNDNTIELINEYIEKYPECNLKVYENSENLGYKRNFHRALSLCKGEIVFLCDQDDIWMENKVEVMSKVLKEHPEVGVVSSAFIQMDGDGNNETPKTVYSRKLVKGELACVPIEDLIFHNISQGCSMAVRSDIKDLFLENFSEEIPHDWAMNIIAAMKKKCYYLNEYLFCYRIHDKNTIGLSDNLTLEKKNTLEIRIHDAMQALKVIGLIQCVDKSYYDNNAKLKEMSSFAVLHVKNLKEKRFFSLLLQNFNVHYKKLKSFRGRILDLFFVLNK